MKAKRKQNLRSNPYNTIDQFADFIDRDMPPYLVREVFAENYPESAKNAKSLRMQGELYSGNNFVWVGTKGRTIKVPASYVYPIAGNEFDFDKLSAIANAPNVFRFKIPFFCGYAALGEITAGHVKEYEENPELSDEDFYVPSADDIGKISYQLRDGNHRTLGAFLAGEPFAYVIVSDNDMQDYNDWVAKGRPSTDRRFKVLQYLDQNLV